MSFDIFSTDAELELTEEDGFLNCILISLFTDARSTQGQEYCQKGYWVDSISLDKPRVGSRLWTLSRSIISQQTLQECVEYAKEALAWMIEQKLVNNIHIVPERRNDSIWLNIDLDAKIYEVKLS